MMDYIYFVLLVNKCDSNLWMFW